MAKASLTNPMAINPTLVADLEVRSAVIDFRANTVRIHYIAKDADGVQVDERELVADGATVATWVGNQEATILTRLMAKLGVAGTVV